MATTEPDEHDHEADRERAPDSQAHRQTTETDHDADAEPDQPEPTAANTTDDDTVDTATADAGHEECRETVALDTREDVLARDGHRCQVCGRCGPAAGGLATLHVHHIDRDPTPAGIDEHDVVNLTTVCRACHSWIHERQTRAHAPVELTEADMTELLSQDIEILRVLADAGPLRVSDVAAELSLDRSVNSVRERLWVLMGLDAVVEQRDTPLVAKDVETGAWGLTEQIATSERGHIPEDQQLLVQRVKDEQVRRALERGVDRQTVMDVFDLSRRATFYKRKRARAFGFPLDAFARGGRPTAGATTGTGADATASTTTTATASEDGEMKPGANGDSAGDDAVTADGDPTEDRAPTETWGADGEPGATDAATDTNGGARGAGAGTGTDADVDAGAGDGESSEQVIATHLQRAITALRAIEAAVAGQSGEECPADE